MPVESFYKIKGNIEFGIDNYFQEKEIIQPNANGTEIIHARSIKKLRESCKERIIS